MCKIHNKPLSFLWCAEMLKKQEAMHFQSDAYIYTYISIYSAQAATFDPSAKQDC